MTAGRIDTPRDAAYIELWATCKPSFARASMNLETFNKQFGNE
jgi:hypothetical protein